MRSFWSSARWMQTAGKLHSLSSALSALARWIDLTKMTTFVVGVVLAVVMVDGGDVLMGVMLTVCLRVGG